MTASNIDGITIFAFEVEFSDRNGSTYESIGLRPEQIMMLRFEPALPELTPEIVTA